MPAHDPLCQCRSWAHRTRGIAPYAASARHAGRPARPSGRSRTARRGARPSIRGSASARCGASASPPGRRRRTARSRCRGCRRAPRARRPTGVESTGTSHASASSTASPNPSRSDGREHRVGGVDPQRHLRRLDAPERQQLDVAGDRARAVVALLGPARVGGEQEVGAVRAQAELRAGLGARDRREAAPCRRRRGAPRSASGSPSAEPARAAAARPRPRGRAAAGRRCVSARERGCDEVGAVERDRVRVRADRERRPRGQPEVGVDDVEALAAVAAAKRRRRARVRGRRSRARTRTARRSSSGIRSQRLAPGRGRSCRAPGSRAMGYMLVTISARIASRAYPGRGRPL